MTEPRRLREESTSSFERAILDAGAGYRSSSDAKLRTLAALGIAGSAAVSASAAASSFASSVIGKLSWGKLVGVVSAIGVAGALPIAYWAAHRNAEPLAPPVLAHLAKTSPALVRPAQPAPSPEAAPVAAVAPPVVAEAREDAAPVPLVRAAKPESKPAVPAAVLTEELAALDTARSALAKGDARRALTLLDSYAKSYPRGRLMLEAEVLRIDALARSGETQAAKQRAATFLRRHPNSVLSARVRTYLDG